MANKNRQNRAANQQSSKPSGSENATTQQATVQPLSARNERNNPNRSRNIAIATGIAIALILGLLALAFLVASLATGQDAASEGDSDTDQTQTTSSDNENNSGTPGDNGTETSATTTSQSAESNGNQGNEGKGEEGSEDGNVDGTSTDMPSSYRQTAGRGDSVSTLARRAMSEYLGDRGDSLDRAQRLFMEVNLKNIIGSRLLEVGESLTFQTSDMDRLFTQSQNLGSNYNAWHRAAVSAGYR